MAKAKARATRAKAKKKHWLKIYSGKPFNEQIIGETFIADANLAIGKPILVNLMTLTGDIKKQNTKIKFQIDAVSEGKAHTKVIGYEVVSAALKRLIRRRSSKVEMSFDAVTADGVKIRIKPFILTRGKTNNSVLTAIRKQVQKNLLETISNTGFQNLVQDIVNHKIQVILKKQLAKIHPIKISEIKFMKIKKSAEAPREVKKAVKEAPKKEVGLSKAKRTSLPVGERTEKKPKEEKKAEEKQTEPEQQEKQPKETKKEEPTKEPVETKAETVPEKEPTETKVEE